MRLETGRQCPCSRPREDDLFGCGSTLMRVRCAASRGLLAATALSIPPEHAGGCRNKVCTPLTPSSHGPSCITAPHVSFPPPTSSAITCCNSTSIPDCSNYPGAMAPRSEVKHSSGRSSSLVVRTGPGSNALLTSRLKRSKSIV